MGDARRGVVLGRVGTIFAGQAGRVTVERGRRVAFPAAAFELGHRNAFDTRTGAALPSGTLCARFAHALGRKCSRFQVGAGAAGRDLDIRARPLIIARLPRLSEQALNASTVGRGRCRDEFCTTSARGHGHGRAQRLVDRVAVASADRANPTHGISRLGPINVALADRACNDRVSFTSVRICRERAVRTGSTTRVHEESAWDGSLSAAALCV